MRRRRCALARPRLSSFGSEFCCLADAGLAGWPGLPRRSSVSQQLVNCDGALGFAREFGYRFGVLREAGEVGARQTLLLSPLLYGRRSIAELSCYSRGANKFNRAFYCVHVP